MKTIRKELNKLIKELIEEGTISHTQEYPDEPYPGQHSFDASADEEYEEIQGYEEDSKSDSQYGKVMKWVKEGIKYVKLFNESGILYKAGVKKYGKDGMKKIQQAAGKRLSHAEIGAIKDKYEKGKKNEGGEGSGRPAKKGGAKDIENKAMKAATDANAKMDAAEKAAKKKKKNEGKLTEAWDSDVKDFGKKSGIKVKPHRGTLGAYGAKPVKPEISKKVVPFFKKKGYKLIKQHKVSSGAYKGDLVFVLQGKDKKKYIVSVNTNREGTNINFNLHEGKLTESGAQIAKTILKQLGGNKFIAMTGAKNLGHTNKGLQMKIGRNAKGVTHVIIDLDRGKDLYDIEFVKVRGTKRTTVKKLKGIYADQLGKIFTQYTGLHIRL